MSADYTVEEQNADVVDRLKAGTALKLFVFALQLVPVSIRQCKETVYCWGKGRDIADLLERVEAKIGIPCLNDEDHW